MHHMYPLACQFKKKSLYNIDDECYDSLMNNFNFALYIPYFGNHWLVQRAKEEGTKNE